MEAEAFSVEFDIRGDICQYRERRRSRKYRWYNVERLHKFLARSGIASRREAEKLIKKGLVQVNGKTVSEMGYKINPDRDQVTFKGKRVQPEKEKVYLMFNKPARVVTTLRDPQQRAKVSDFLKGLITRVYPVGRLDYNSEGLLLMTNDGDLAYRMLHPKFRVEKTYLVWVKGMVSPQALERLARGVFLEDGPTLPARVRRIAGKEGNTLLEITIREGRNRQVRRMCQVVGHDVLSLKRTRFGPLTLGGLQPGCYRPLTEKEVRQLRKICDLK